MAINVYNFLRSLESYPEEKKDQIFYALDNTLFSEHLCHSHYDQLKKLLNGKQYSDFTAYVKTIIPFYGLVYILLDCPETAEKWENVVDSKDFSVYGLFNEYRNFVHERNTTMSYAI